MEMKILLWVKMSPIGKNGGIYSLIKDSVAGSGGNWKLLFKLK
jgi:hypothetical protein